MAQCPVCQNELPDDFGLIDCASCKTPLIVQLDGSVEAASASASEIALDHAEVVESVTYDDLAPDEHAAEIGIAEAPAEDVSAAPMPSSADDVDAFFEDTPAAPVIETPISDLSSLANSVDTSAIGGALRYTIEVSGIDTVDIRNDFRETISDRRFLWDVDRILKSIRAGQVKIGDVSAVKALLLIHRLRSLPVRVQWEQHALHES